MAAALPMPRILSSNSASYFLSAFKMSSRLVTRDFKDSTSVITAF